MITYPISSNLSKKFLCNVIAFTIFHLSEVATGGVLLEKYSWKFCKIHRKTPGAKSLFNKVAGRGERLLLIFFVSSLEDFFFISFQQKNGMKKGKYPDAAQIFTSLLEYRFV